MKGKIVYLILIVLSFCACQEEAENENGEGWLAIEFLTDKVFGLVLQNLNTNCE